MGINRVFSLVTPSEDISIGILAHVTVAMALPHIYPEILCLVVIKGTEAFVPSTVHSPGDRYVSLLLITPLLAVSLVLLVIPVATLVVALFVLSVLVVFHDYFLVVIGIGGE